MTTQAISSLAMCRSEGSLMLSAVGPYMKRHSTVSIDLIASHHAQLRNWLRIVRHDQNAWHGLPGNTLPSGWWIIPGAFVGSGIWVGLVVLGIQVLGG